MSQITEQACCPKSNIANLTFKTNIDNRVCLSCGAHWYDGKRYTRKEWDLMMEAEQ